MRTFVIVSALVVAVSLTGCKKAEVPQKAPPEKAAQKAAPQPAEPAKAAAPEEAKKEAQAEPAPEAEKKPGELDPASCKDRIAADERRIKQEFLPKLQAEQEALQRVTSWVERTYKLIEAGEGETGKAEIERFWVDYRECLKNATAPKAERDPECVAYVSEDPTACDRIGNAQTRKNCVDNIRIKPMHRFWRDWAANGFAKEYCKNAPAGSMLSERFVCEAMAVTENCGEGVVSAIARRNTELCEAAKAALRGEKTCADYPEGAPECATIKALEAQDRKAACLAQVAEGLAPFPKEACEDVDKFESFDCAMAAEMVKQRSVTQDPEKKFAADECEILLALRKGKTGCDGTFSADSDNCTNFLGVKAALSGDRGVCDALTSERRRDRCRGFLSDKLDDCAQAGSDKWGTGPADDTPCRKMLWSKNVLPATEGRTEVRVTITNVFDDPAKCVIPVKMTADASAASKMADLQFEGPQTRILSFFFVTEPGAVYEVTPNCEWQRKPPEAGEPPRTEEAK